MTATSLASFVGVASSASVVKPSTAKSRSFGFRPPTSSLRYHHHHHHRGLHYGNSSDHTFVAFNDREIQRRLLALDDTVDSSDEAAAVGSAATSVVSSTSSPAAFLRGREATNVGAAAGLVAWSSAMPPAPAWPRGSLNGHRQRSPWVAAPNGGRRTRGCSSGDANWVSADDICPWPMTCNAVELMTKASKRSSAADIERRDAVTSRPNDTSTSAPPVVRQCACSNADRGQQQSSLAQAQQSRSEIPFVFRHWRGSSDDGDGAKSGDNGIEVCSDDRSPARRQYIDQYRADYTYAQIIREFEPAALQSSYVTMVIAGDETAFKSTVDSRGADSRRGQCGSSRGGGGGGTDGSAQATATPLSVSSWEVAASVVASVAGANGGCATVPAVRSIHHRPFGESKLTASDPALNQDHILQQLQPDATADKGCNGDDRTTHRSAPPAVITQVHFVRRKINVPAASEPDDGVCADCADADGVDELTANDPRQRRHRKPRGGRCNGAAVCPAPGMRASNSCGSLPTKVNLEPPIASSSSPSSSASATSAPATFLPRVSGGSCCSNGGGNASNASEQLQSANGRGTVAAADATDGNGSSSSSGGGGSSATIPGHQLLVAFTGKTIKPIPSNGFSIDRSTSRRQSTTLAVPADGLRTLDLLVHLSCPDKLQLQTAQKEADEVRHIIWYGSQCVDCLGSRNSAAVDKHCKTASGEIHVPLFF